MIQGGDLSIKHEVGDMQRNGMDTVTEAETVQTLVHNLVGQFLMKQITVWNTSHDEDSLWTRCTN